MLTLRKLLWGFWENVEPSYPYNDCFWTPRHLYACTGSGYDSE